MKHKRCNTFGRQVVLPAERTPWVRGRSRQPAACALLVGSPRRFSDQQEMKMMEIAGLDRVDYKNLSCGIACLYLGAKA